MDCWINHIIHFKAIQRERHSCRLNQIRSRNLVGNMRSVEGGQRKSPIWFVSDAEEK